MTYVVWLLNKNLERERKLYQSDWENAAILFALNEQGKEGTDILSLHEVSKENDVPSKGPYLAG